MVTDKLAQSYLEWRIGRFHHGQFQSRRFHSITLSHCIAYCRQTVLSRLSHYYPYDR